MMLKQEKSKARQAFCETLPIFSPQFPHHLFLCPRRWGHWGQDGQEILLQGHGVRAPSRPCGCTGAAVDQAAAQQLAVGVGLRPRTSWMQCSLQSAQPRWSPEGREPVLDPAHRGVLCLLARGLRQPLPGFGEEPSGSEVRGALMVHTNILCVMHRDRGDLQRHRSTLAHTIPSPFGHLGQQYSCSVAQ